MNRVSIAARLYGIIAIFTVALAIFGGSALLSERESLYAARISQLKSLVDAAMGVAERYRGEVTKGTMTEAEAKAAAYADIGAMRYGKGDYIFVIDEAGVTIAHSVNPKALGKNFSGVADARGFLFTADVLPRALRDGSATVTYQWQRAGESEPIDKLSYYGHFKPWGVIMVTGVYIDDLRAELAAAAWQLLVKGTLIVLLLGVVTMFLVRSIIRPLHALNGDMRTLAAGNTEIAIREVALRDEVGMMARSLVVLRDGLVEREALAAAQARDQDVRVRRAQQLDRLASTFEADISVLAGEMSGAASAMERTSTTMSRVIAHTTEQSVGAVAAAEQTSANVQTVAAATEELAASIREIATQVMRSSQISRRAAEEAQRTDTIVKTLAVTAERIGGVIAVINSIARQTDLLALNATIEAARAGQAGRGFAVVASEVKELASQTARATDEVGNQIAAIQAETRQAVIAIDAIGGIINEVDSIATGIAAAMEEQGVATEEIARNVQEAAQGTLSVNGAITQMRHATTDVEASSVHVLGSAQSLGRTSNALSMTVSEFLGNVKAA